MVAIRQPDGKVNLKQSINLVGIGAASGGLSGALWGSVVGLLFLNPLAGMTVAALLGQGAERFREGSSITASRTISSAGSGRRSSPTPLRCSC